MAPAKKLRIVLSGNPGGGKSCILNSLIGQVIFPNGLKQVVQSYELSDRVYLDTAARETALERELVAREILSALSDGGDFKLIFVCTLEAARVRPVDAIFIRLVLEAIEALNVQIAGRYSVIVNKCTMGEMNKLESVRIREMVRGIFSGVKPLHHIGFFPLLPDADEKKYFLIEDCSSYAKFIEDAPILRLPTGRAFNMDDQMRHQLEKELHDLRANLANTEKQRNEKQWNNVLGALLGPVLRPAASSWLRSWWSTEGPSRSGTKTVGPSRSGTETAGPSRSGTETAGPSRSGTETVGVSRSDAGTMSKNFSEHAESVASSCFSSSISATFSSRFSAAWGELKDRTGTIWLCTMDGDHSVFALKSTSSVEEGEVEDVVLQLKGRTVSVRCLNLPSRVMSWSTLQQSAADFMDTDNEIRAVLVACIVCAHGEGDNACAPKALVPKSLNSLSTCVQYDLPVDDDLITALADPVNIEGQLHFKCGLGTLAQAVESDSGVCHLKEVDARKEPLQHEEKVLSRLPLLYGFGKFLDTGEPRTTTQVEEILRKLPNNGGVSKLLWAVAKAAPYLYSDGDLDLSVAALLIFDAKGAFLGTRKMRKIRSKVLIIGKDGIYRSSRFFGLAVTGSLEVSLLLVKLGLQTGKKVDSKKDERIDNLSVIAQYILGQEYEVQYRDKDTDSLVKGPLDLWHDETAVCNTLAALIARKYGRFTGFSAVVSTPCCVKVHQDYTMEANIFLPVLKVWVPRGLPLDIESADVRPSKSQVREIRVQKRKVLAYAGPTVNCSKSSGNGTIEVVADLSSSFQVIPQDKIFDIRGVDGA